MPDIEQHFWKKYKDRGLTVVALNAHDPQEQMPQVRRFIEELGLSYDVGLELSETYQALASNFEGTNPFPLDVVVGKDGTIAYVGREYDALLLTEIVENLLAE